MSKLGLKKEKNQIGNIPWMIEKARKFQKNIYFCFIDYAKAFDCVDHTNCGKFFKRWEYQTTLPASWEIRMQVKKQQLEPDMEQWTGFKLGKQYVKALYCHPAYLTYMQSISCKMLGWMKHKLESRFPGNHPYGRKHRTSLIGQFHSSSRQEIVSSPRENDPFVGFT